MALQSSGAISLNQIHVEAGGTSGTTASLNDADIRGLIDKASGASNAFSEYYGASAETDMSTVSGTATINGQTTLKQATVSSYISSGGTINIPSGMWIWSDSTSTAALVVDIPCTIINNGYIIGKGGDGGAFRSAGNAGGPAIKINSGVTGVTITNNSGAYIAGGGGGGGSGEAGGGASGGGGGGAGGGAGGLSGGAGGAINAAGANGAQFASSINGNSRYVEGGFGGGSGGGGGQNVYDAVSRSGGGGGRILPGTGGDGGRYFYSSSTPTGNFSKNSGDGGDGGTAGGGAGTGAGGGGGGWGAAGGNGGYSGATGGAGGKAIDGADNSFTLSSSGTVFGDIPASANATTLNEGNINGQSNAKEILASDFVTSGGTLTIPSNFWVWSDSTSTAALTIDIPCTVVNNGKIIGRGGNGGVAGGDGSAGGPAIKINSGVTGVTITNGSGAYIAGGGGGGGGGYTAAGGGGGAGGGAGGRSSSDATGGTGGILAASGGDGTGYSWASGSTGATVATDLGGNGGGAGGEGGYLNDSGARIGGGAGGRILPGSGGAGGFAYNGGGASSAGSAWNGTNVPDSYYGGGGGGWGAAGGNGRGTSGGPGGKAIDDSGVTYSLTNSGLIYGAT